MAVKARKTAKHFWALSKLLQGKACIACAWRRVKGRVKE